MPDRPDDGATSQQVDPQALVASFWFDPGAVGPPYVARARVTGRRLGIRGKPGAADVFAQDEIIDPVLPGAGPMTISTWVYGVRQGEWSVEARLVPSPDSAAPQRLPTLHRAGWSWRRWTVTTAPSGPVATRWALPAPLARIPGVVPGSWPLLGSIGVTFAVFLQSLILASLGFAVPDAALISLIAIVGGLVGAKLWYIAEHPREPITRGWSVDGFLVVMPVLAGLLLMVDGRPIGTVLDASAPGIFFAVAIGRVGCFLTGCCAGNCTVSRWGIWSSDRRIGARRVPVQLVEALVGLVLGLAGLWLVLGVHVRPAGLSFIATLAVYLLIRQWLLRIRAERGRPKAKMPVTAAAGVVVLVSTVGLLVVQAR